MTKIMHYLTAAACSAVLAIPAMAQVSNDDTTLIKRITDAQMSTIISRIPDHTLLDDSATSSLYAIGETADGLKYVAQGAACNDDGCLGLLIQVRYTVDWPQNYEYLNVANYQRAAATTLREGDDTVIVQRYLILDGGMTAKNIEYSIRNLIGIAPNALQLARTGTLEEGTQ